MMRRSRSHLPPSLPSPLPFLAAISCVATTQTTHSRAIRAAYYCFLALVAFGHVEFFTGGALCRYAKASLVSAGAAGNATETLLEPIAAMM